MKNMIRKLIAPGLGLSLLLTGGTANAFENENVPSNLSTIKPIVETGDMISYSKGKGKKKDKEREKFVTDTVNHAFYVVGQGKYNVVVANTSNHLLWDSNSKHYKNYSVMYGNETYWVWLYEYLHLITITSDRKSDFGFKGNCHKEGGKLYCLAI
ncbi:hypothetical protein [Priestia taiwanensis]|uniref:Uncharacterized protein n=1 Tax=Priestia taiwanensis TaxID=1347902 RepID=A0A917EMU6_9BACI|nr:hypothetical protein [Priestia taiwanensis]MBM7361951.1 hypothetical protein [Priestia taiwanensis]GGE58305.1 hypothetical protein GCM10007140_05800 [Priestia taiwanensis]